jgi:hypothetical protein
VSTVWTPLRAGVLHIEELPMATRDVEVAGRLIPADSHVAVAIAPAASVSVGWPAALVGFDHLPLVFPRGNAGKQNPGRLRSEQP